MSTNKNRSITKRQRHALKAFQEYQEAEKKRRDAIERHLNRHSNIYGSVHAKIKAASQEEIFPRNEQLQSRSSTMGITHTKLGISLYQQFPTGAGGAVMATDNGWQLGYDFQVIQIMESEHSMEIYFTYRLPDQSGVHLARINGSELSLSDREIASKARRHIASAKRALNDKALQEQQKKLQRMEQEFRALERSRSTLEQNLKEQRDRARKMEREAMEQSAKRAKMARAASAVKTHSIEGVA